MSRRALAYPCAALAALVAFSGATRAAPLDPSRAYVVAVGSPPALAACPGIDARASQRSPLALPLHPVVSGNVRLSRGIRHAPASDAKGRLLLAQDDGTLTQLDERGHAEWRVSTDGELTSAPIIVSDGARWIVAHGGELRTFDERGNPGCRRALPGVDAQRETLAVPTPSGGALLASGAQLLVLGADCELERDTRASDRVVSVLASGQALFAVLEDGTVLRAPVVGGFQRVARFGGKVASAALRGAELVALVDQHALESADLASGSVRTLAAEAGLTLVGSPALLANGGLILATDDELLSVRAADGRELLRIPLSTPRALQRPRPALMLADEHGSLLAAQPAQDAWLISSSDGKLASVEGTACSEPFPPVPLGKGRVAIACRSGQIVYLAEKAGGQSQ